MIYRCWTKGTRREKCPPRRSVNWAVSRRGWFRIFADRVQCGNWLIPVPEIQRAVLYHGRQFWLPVRVLELETEGGTYQFGFNPWVRVESHLAFPFSRQEVRLKYSIFSVAVRAALVLYLAFIIWRWLS